MKRVMPSHEDQHVFAVRVTNISAGMNIVNTIGCADMLLHIVPVSDDSYWLVFKDDSWLKMELGEHFPTVMTISVD